MNRAFLVIVIYLFHIRGAAQRIRYDFSAPNAVHHEAEITLTASGLLPGPAIFRMSRSSPGRYATHEFGKNVYNVHATDENGHSLQVEKTDGEVYKVAAHKGIVKLSYTLFANYADGTYAGIDITGYHLNMPAVFMWVKGMDKAPITVHFNVPEKSWKIATQLKPGPDTYTFTAPGLQRFMDAPTKIGELHMREWRLSNPDNKQYTFRLALEADAKEKDIDSFASKLQKLVKEEQAVFSEFPSYDYGAYTFIASINPYVYSDGMEHRNSTMISNGRLFTGNENQLSVFAHEFFHSWNVKRIRPKSLEPFNFEKSNMSDLLWVAEGFTQYYGLLLMERAGITSVQDFYVEMAGLINAIKNTPGGKYYSPVENSERAVYTDAGVAVDKSNYPNNFLSYYFHGGALALALDLQLREKFGKSLDDLMKAMWKDFGKPEIPYTLADLERTLAHVSNRSFAKDFFRKYVYGHETPDYSPLLQGAGLQLKRAEENKSWIGNPRYGMSNNRVVINTNTIRDTPLYDAGPDADDVILELDDAPVKQASDIEMSLSGHKPGDVIKLVYEHHKKRMQAMMTLKEAPFYTIAVLENANDLRNKWLKSRVK